MSKVILFLQRIAPFFIGFGLVGLADGIDKLYGLVAGIGIILYVQREDSR